MVLWVLVAVVVRFTLPQFEAGEDGCAAAADTLRDLQTVRLRGTKLGGHWGDTLATKSVIGREGKPDSLTFNDQGSPWIVWVETLDDAGLVSCPSNLRTIGDWPVGVGDDAAHAGPVVAALEPIASPARGTVEVRYTVSRAVAGTILVHDVRGRRVAELATGTLSGGAVAWKVGAVPSGLYFVQLVAEGQRITRRVVVLR